MTPATRRLEAAATARLVQWTRRRLGLTYRDVALLTGVATRTAQRWGDPRSLSLPDEEHRVRLDEVRELKRLLEAVFTAPRDAANWLHREVPLLEGRRPIDLVRRGEIATVNGVLAGMYAGAFA